MNKLIASGTGVNTRLDNAAQLRSASIEKNSSGQVIALKFVGEGNRHDVCLGPVTDVKVLESFLQRFGILLVSDYAGIVNVDELLADARTEVALAVVS